MQETKGIRLTRPTSTDVGGEPHITATLWPQTLSRFPTLLLYLSPRREKYVTGQHDAGKRIDLHLHGEPT